NLSIISNVAPPEATIKPNTNMSMHNKQAHNAEHRAVLASLQAKLRITADGETIPDYKNDKNNPQYDIEGGVISLKVGFTAKASEINEQKPLCSVKIIRDNTSIPIRMIAP